MAGRRVIATAEVQVAADVKQAEVGLNGLTETFRQIGATAERAAEKAEAAFFGTARSIKGGYGQIIQASEDLLTKMEKGDRVARMMAETFREALVAIKAMSNQDMDAKAIEALRTFKQIAGTAGVIDGELHNAAASAARLTRAAQEIEGEIRAAEIRAEMLGKAFRDVGQEIEVALFGGMEGLQDDIRTTIRQLDKMGGEFQEVGRIGERALDGILEEVDADADQATAALIRLERQLRDVAVSGANALDELDDDARKAALALNSVETQARGADRALDRIGSVSRRVSGDVRGLAGLLGAAGIGFAASSAARAGLDMTLQLEKAEAMFLGLTGSVEGAANMLERMVVFARETPFNLAQVTDAAAQLLAVGDGFGVTTSNVEDYLEAFGNAITMTGGGDEQFTRLVRVFGQMSSSGKVLGQDMNQLAQNLPGFDVWQALADGANTSVTELRRLQDLGQLDNLLTGNEAVQILIEGMEQIPGAAGAMERRMNTLGGAIEKFKETAQFAMSEGLIPFSETAQDTLSDPVILNSVEDLSFAFGDLLSKALQDVRPELDDLAASGEDLLLAFQDWTPVLETIVDGIGDFIGFIAPLVSGLGKAVEGVLNFGDGLGKLAVAAGLAATGPWGMAAGLVLGVSGAVDLFSDSNEDAANMARLLAAAQGEVNTAMAAGEEVIVSEAQQLAIDTATELRDKYGELANAMATFDVSVGDLQTGMAALASGTGEVPAELQRMLDYFNNPDMKGDKVIGQFEAISEAYKNETSVIDEETTKQQEILAIAGTEEIAAMEEREARQKAYNEAVAQYWEDYGETYQAAMDAEAEAKAGWGELDEEHTDSLKGLLEDQAAAYEEWAANIDDSTSGAALSLSQVAEDAENSVDAMIDAINLHSIATNNWKSNIVTAAVNIQKSLGLTDTEAQEFMGTLGEMGPAAAPALQAMIDDFANGGTQLQDFFNATKMNADVMATDLTTAFDDATGSVPTLAESLAEGTATIDEVLAALPAAMEAAGIDMEAAAAMIDMSGEMGTVGLEAVNGLVAALDAGVGRARAAGQRLANAASSGTQMGLQVESPSKVFIDIGEFAVEGLVIGMDSMSDEAYAQAVQTASLLTGGIEHHFREAEDPQEEARKFAEDVAESIIDELIAEQEAVADAAEALAEAAADRLSEAWDRVKDRFRTRDLAESVAEAQADLSEARADLAAAEALAGTAGSEALAAAQARINNAQARIAESQVALANAEAADAAAELLADKTLKDFQRSTEDAVAALKDQQEQETADINQRIADAKRRLDPVARAAAEADLKASAERHEAEMTALERQREDEEAVLQLRLDNEDAVRDAAIKAQEDQVKAWEDALKDATDEFADIGDKIADAIESLPGLREDVGDAGRDLEGAFFDQFESLLENVSSVDRGLLESVGANAGLTAQEVTDLINSALASESAAAGASAANLGLDQLLNLLTTGLFTLGANGALGIAEGLSSQAQAIAEGLFGTVEWAINNALAHLEIHSPSGVTERLIGKPLAEGIAVGLMSAENAVSSAMTGLLDSVVGGVRIPPSSQLVGNTASGGEQMSMYRGPLVTMPGAVIQDATDADLVAQRVVVALSATGVEV